MKIIITINGIDTCSLGDWDGRDLNSVANDYQQFLTQKIANELTQTTELPPHEAIIKTNSTVQALQYNVNIIDCDDEYLYEVDSTVRDILIYSLQDSYDQFCNQ